MSRLSGRATDTQPLEPLEYRLVMAKLPKHWQIFYELMWQTGARVGEVLRLSKRDVENTGVWITSEKRSDTLREFVPLTPDFYRTLQDLADKRREAHLFPYTPQAAWLALRKAGKDAGVRTGTIHSNLIISPERRLSKRVSRLKRRHYIKPTIAEVRDAFSNVNKGSQT